MKSYTISVFILALVLTGCRSSSSDTNGNTAIKTSDSASQTQVIDSSGLKVSDSLNSVQELVRPDSVSVRRIPVEISQDVLERYAGSYELLLDPSNLFEVTVSQGELYFTGLQGLKVQFYAENDTAFFDNPNSTETLAFKKRGDQYNMVLINRKGYMLEARRLP